MIVTHTFVCMPIYKLWSSCFWKINAEVNSRSAVLSECGAREIHGNTAISNGVYIFNVLCILPVYNYSLLHNMGSLIKLGFVNQEIHEPKIIKLQGPYSLTQERSMIISACLPASWEIHCFKDDWGPKWSNKAVTMSLVYSWCCMYT